MRKSIQQDDTRLLAALRAEAGKFSDISEFRMSGCTAFSVHGRIAACACGNLIALRLPELSVTALPQTPGCRLFQSYGRTSSRHWLAFTATSPAFNTLDGLFEEAVAFSHESPGADR